MNLNMPLRFYALESDYVPGEGATGRWVPFTSSLGETAISIFWAEWRGGFGSQLLAAQAAGVNEMATVQMPYHPDLCALLRSTMVLIAKNADETVLDSEGTWDAANVNGYKLFGGVDDIREEHREMEFKVRRYEGK